MKTLTLPDSFFDMASALTGGEVCAVIEALRHFRDTGEDPDIEGASKETVAVYRHGRTFLEMMQRRKENRRRK